MKALKITTTLWIFFLAVSMTSCLKIETRDAGEKANELLEGNWKLEEFRLNGNLLPTGDGEITILFVPTEDVSKTGKMITSQPESNDQVQDYTIDADGKTMMVDGALAEFTVNSTSLTMLQTSTELGEPVELEMTLSRK